MSGVRPTRTACATRPRWPPSLACESLRLSSIFSLTFSGVRGEINTNGQERPATGTGALEGNTDKTDSTDSHGLALPAKYPRSRLTRKVRAKSFIHVTLFGLNMSFRCFRVLCG